MEKNDELVIKMINEQIKTMRLNRNISVKGISDTNHTFEELYNYRTLLLSIVCNLYKEISWKSKKHFDEENDPMYNGDFIVGINTPKGITSYHIKLIYWDLFDIPELEKGYKYDAHSKEEDLIYLMSLVEASKQKVYKKDIRN